MANQKRSAVRHPVEFTLRDVRCFAGEQRGRTRPITLLVGENGTGKTTFLGCYGALHRLLSSAPVEKPDFNAGAFAMGSFRDIVRARRGRDGRIEEFELGFTLDGQREDRLAATFREEGSQPAVASLGCRDIGNLPDLVPVPTHHSKPTRTFGPVRDTTSAVENHIRALVYGCRWDAVHDELVEFGRSAGLFSDIKLKRQGEQADDRFQLHVKVRGGPYVNVVDAGSGINQSLPLLLEVMTPNGSSPCPGGRTFVLQQPGAHLHPRCQAQLANLFIKALKERDSRFLIETHSDYIVDRVRISVRQGLLPPDDVSILYFEPKAKAVTIHSMYLDADGNLEGAPPGYREFFLKETNKLLGFSD